MVIDDKLLDSLLEKAAENPRLRTNLDLRNGPDDGSQRMLNAMLPGTQVPIHRHRATSESFVVLRGSLTEIFFDERGVECARYDLAMPGSTQATHGNRGIGLLIPAGMWHTVIVHEPTVILECKDGAFAPLSSEDVWNYE